MSRGFRASALILMAVALFLPGFYCKAEVKMLNAARLADIQYWRGRMEQVNNQCMRDDACDALGLLFWNGQVIHEIQVLEVPIVPHYDATYALGDFYFGWILN